MQRPSSNLLAQRIFHSGRSIWQVEDEFLEHFPQGTEDAGEGTDEPASEEGVVGDVCAEGEKREETAPADGGEVPGGDESKSDPSEGPAGAEEAAIAMGAQVMGSEVSSGAAEAVEATKFDPHNDLSMHNTPPLKPSPQELSPRFKKIWVSKKQVPIR